jgi:hypothetical protein
MEELTKKVKKFMELILEEFTWKVEVWEAYLEKEKDVDVESWSLIEQKAHFEEGNRILEEFHEHPVKTGRYLLMDAIKERAENFLKLPDNMSKRTKEKLEKTVDFINDVNQSDALYYGTWKAIEVDLLEVETKLRR